MMNNGWIPVEKRLPNTDKYIMLSFENFDLPVVGRYEEDDKGYGNFYIGDSEETCISEDMYVNAWMPLLKPYRGEDDAVVDHPEHYQGKYECIDEMISLFGIEDVKAFCRCNVYKYRYRADRKNGAEDIRKAEWYMEKLMELEGME